MQKVVLKLDVHDDARCKRRVMKLVSGSHGLDSISMDMKEQTLTVTGNMDPVQIVEKLRKVFHVEVLSVGPVKEPEKQKESKESKDQVPVPGFFLTFEPYNYNYPYYPRYHY